MRPPICGICDKDIEPDEKGGLIYFAKRASDIAWHKKMKKIHGVGHPPEAEWFCEEHYPRAKELQNLTIDEAFEILKKEFAK